MKPFEIDTRELYDYALKRGIEPLIDERFHLPNALRREIQRERFGGNDAEGNSKFYDFCLKNLPLVCEECGCPIRHPWAINVSHILTRGGFPEMAHDPRNVYILCAKHHEQYEHKTTRKAMRIFEKSEQRINLLKKEYNHGT